MFDTFPCKQRRKKDILMERMEETHKIMQLPKEPEHIHPIIIVSDEITEWKTEEGIKRGDGKNEPGT